MLFFLQGRVEFPELSQEDREPRTERNRIDSRSLKLNAQLAN